MKLREPDGPDAPEKTPASNQAEALAKPAGRTNLVSRRQALRMIYGRGCAK